MRCGLWRSAVGVFVLCVTASAMGQAPSSPPYAYELPIRGGGCGGFSFSNGSMSLFEYEGRQLYEVSRGRLVPREDVKGWYVVDAAVIYTLSLHDALPIYRKSVV